jgi:hypothetical protein
VTDARVARLTLTAPDSAAVQRGAILVEDAMRIATLTQAHDHRVMIVRHLDIGAFTPDAAPHTIALQIEQDLADVQRAAVPASAPGAPGAAAVWFADEPTAIAELARRIAAGPPPHEWFWRHIADNAVALPQTSALHACLAAAARTPAGPLAVAIAVAAVEDAREGTLLSGLGPSDGDHLLALVFGAGGRAARAGTASVNLGALAPRWIERVARWAAQWGDDPRARWLAALAVIASRGTVGQLDAEVARGDALLAALAPMIATRGDRPAPPAEPEQAIDKTLARDSNPPTQRAAGVSGKRTAPPSRDARSPHDASAAPAPATPRPSPRSAAARGRLAVEDVPPRPPVATEMAAPSTIAGALFLVRPLAALGIADWLAAHDWAEDGAFAARLLADIAAHHLPPGAEDPLVAALAGDSRAVPDGPFVAPACWRELTGIRPRAPHPTSDGAPLAARPWAQRAWRLALHRWLRRYAALTLPDLVRRPATLIATPTHLELTMSLRRVDVRIRAAGLDIDPGWVPWLGRVIRFHYLDEGR